MNEISNQTVPAVRELTQEEIAFATRAENAKREQAGNPEVNGEIYPED